MPTECELLIEAVKQVSYSVMYLATRVDCQTQVLKSSLLDREFVAQHMSNLERLSVEASNQVSQALWALLKTVGNQELPALPSLPTLISNPQDAVPLGCVEVPPFWNEYVPVPNGGGGGQ